MKDDSSSAKETTNETPKRSLEEILNNPATKKMLLDVDAIAARFGGYDDE